MEAMTLSRRPPPAARAVESWYGAGPAASDPVEDIVATCRRIAVAGLHTDPESREFVRIERLLTWGYELFPVHSDCGALCGHPCYARLVDVPEEIDMLLILPTSDEPLSVLAAEAIRREVGAVWVEDAAIDAETAAELRCHGIAVVDRRSFQVEVARRH